jgi:hypothetical protein
MLTLTTMEMPEVDLKDVKSKIISDEEVKMTRHEKGSREPTLRMIRGKPRPRTLSEGYTNRRSLRTGRGEQLESNLPILLAHQANHMSLNPGPMFFHYPS